MPLHDHHSFPIPTHARAHGRTPHAQATAHRHFNNSNCKCACYCPQLCNDFALIWFQHFLLYKYSNGQCHKLWYICNVGVARSLNLGLYNSQHDGPFLGTKKKRGRLVIRNPKRDHSFEKRQYTIGSRECNNVARCTVCTNAFFQVNLGLSLVYHVACCRFVLLQVLFMLLGVPMLSRMLV